MCVKLAHLVRLIARIRPRRWGLIKFIELNTLNDIKVKFLIAMFPDVSIRIIKEGVVAERGGVRQRSYSDGTGFAIAELKPPTSGGISMKGAREILT